MIQNSPSLEAMAFGSRALFRTFVYLTLFIITIYVLLNGPFTNYFRKQGTQFVKSVENINNLNFHIKWPDIVVCVNPKDKNKTNFDNFMFKGMSRNFTDETEYYNMLENTFFTNPNEIMYSFGFGRTYQDALESASPELIKEPYVAKYLIDFVYFGNCAVVKLEELRYKVISNESKEKDANFYFILWLKVIIKFANFARRCTKVLLCLVNHV